MKKKLVSYFSLWKKCKILLIMKLSTILMVIFTLNLSATTGFSQFSFSVEGKKIREVFQIIENESNYRFFYNDDFESVDKVVNLNVENQNVNQVLDRLFESSDFTYKVFENNLIVVSLKENSQQGIVKGIVNDASTGKPMPGVNVAVKGSTIGTITDANGKYSIEVNDPKAVLTFSFIGYASTNIPVEGKSILDIKLTPQINPLSEVVVIGYGTVKKSDLTGSIGSVSSGDLEAFPTLGATSAIQGRTSGVAVTSTNGAPGTMPRIRIRGGTSINAGSDPLYVVDGFAGASEPDPDDIQSVEILKDASATAIYGSRGANGVVLITTKSGESGKTKIEFNTSYSIEKVSKKLDMLDATQFAQYINQLNINDGIATVPYPNPAQYGTGTNWQDLIFRTGGLQKYTLTASGGKDNLKFFTSLNYYGDMGTILNSNYERISDLTNLDVKISDHARFGTKVFFNRTTNNSIVTQEGSSGTGGAGVIFSALKMEPTLGVYDANGNFTISQIGDPIDNPVAIATQQQSNSVTDLFQDNSFFELDLLKGLVFHATFGVNILNARLGQFMPSTLLGGLADGGDASIATNKNTILSNEDYLNYKISINESNNLDLMAGYSYQSSRGEYWNAENQNFISNSFSYWNLGGGSNYVDPSSGLSQWVLASFYGRMNYSFKDKYLLTFTGRYDGSSRFGADNKWAFFPSGAFAWNIKKESFMDDVSVLSQLKLRTSYGVTGNTDIGTYQSLAQFTPSTHTYVSGQPVNGVVPYSVANSNLSWESTAQTDIGLDIGFFNQRLLFNADYYYKKTTNLLYNVPLPEYSGYSTSLQNIGSLQNKGWEFAVSTENTTGALKWSTDFNISFNQNKILSLSGGDLQYSSVPGQLIAGNSQILRVGEPVGAFFGWVFDGVYQVGDNFSAEPGKVPGNIKYKDINGRDDKGNLTGKPDGIVNDDDRTIIGNPNPKFTFGFNNTFKYKGFDLNIFFTGSYGNDIMNYTRMAISWNCGYSNSFIDELNAWTPTHTNTDVPMVSRSNPPEVSSRWVEDGSYIRLKNLSLGYNFSDIIVQKLKITKLRVYISAQNLLTITKYSGYDPEVSYQDSNHNYGLDYGSYPSSKLYTLGVDITF